MKKPEDILSKSIEALAKMDVPPGPSPELIDETVAKLTDAGPPAFLRKQEGGQQEAETINIANRLEATKRLIRYAAAAVIMLSAGYIAGRLSSPKAPDLKQLQAALVPAIRQNLLGEMTKYLQVGFTGGFTNLKDELQQQYRQDMTNFAIQTLAASNAITNRRLEQLIESIYAAQTEDRQWVAKALNQVETNRLQDTAQLANAVTTLAVHTEDQLQQTRQDVVRFLANTEPNYLIPNKTENSNEGNAK